MPGGGAPHQPEKAPVVPKLDPQFGNYPHYPKPYPNVPTGICLVSGLRANLEGFFQVTNHPP